MPVRMKSLPLLLLACAALSSSAPVAPEVDTTMLVEVNTCHGSHILYLRVNSLVCFIKGIL